MKSSEKVAISLPSETLRKLERARKRLRLNRSEAIRQAVQMWLSRGEEDPRVAAYVRAYQSHPDDPAETGGHLEAWAEGIDAEKWS